jgi:hypothetical protein
MLLAIVTPVKQERTPVEVSVHAPIVLQEHILMNSVLPNVQFVLLENTLLAV